MVKVFDCDSKDIGSNPIRNPNMVYFDPLEQFSIEISIGYLQSLLALFNIFTSYPYFTSVTLSQVIFFNFFVVIFCIFNTQKIFRQNIFQKLILNLYKFVVNILQDTIVIKKYSFVLLFYVVFLFIFISNILGMIPYSVTVTSHLILTIFFSLAFFLGNNLIGICFHKEHFFSLFLPDGVPVIIIPFLILIEYVSYISRIFSLAIRLFANMLSGHILLKILITFIWSVVISNIVH
jgi:ATP synthase subunit 6